MGPGGAFGVDDGGGLVGQGAGGHIPSTVNRCSRPVTASARLPRRPYGVRRAGPGPGCPRGRPGRGPRRRGARPGACAPAAPGPGGRPRPAPPRPARRGSGGRSGCTRSWAASSSPRHPPGHGRGCGSAPCRRAGSPHSAASRRMPTLRVSPTATERASASAPHQGLGRHVEGVRQIQVGPGPVGWLVQRAVPPDQPVDRPAHPLQVPVGEQAVLQLERMGGGPRAGGGVSLLPGGSGLSRQSASARSVSRRTKACATPASRAASMCTVTVRVQPPMAASRCWVTTRTGRSGGRSATGRSSHSR